MIIDTQKSRRSRTKYTPFQIAEMEQCFTLNRYLTSERLSKLSKHLLLESTQIKIWFKNRRRRHKLQTTVHQEMDRSFEEIYQAMKSESISSSPLSSSRSNRRCKSRINCSSSSSSSSNSSSCDSTSSSDNYMDQYSDIHNYYIESPLQSSSQCQQFKPLTIYQFDTNSIQQQTQQQPQPYQKQPHTFDKDISNFDSKNVPNTNNNSDPYYMRISESLASDGQSSSLVSDNDEFPSFCRRDETTGRIINHIDEIDESSKKLLQNLRMNDERADGRHTKRSMTAFSKYATKTLPAYESIFGPPYQYTTMNTIMCMQPYTHYHQHYYTPSIINNAQYSYFYNYC